MRWAMLLCREGLWLIHIWPAWSIMMSSYTHAVPPIVPLTYISIFGIGALVMRGAGCTINDMWDRDLDKAVGEKPPVYLCHRLIRITIERTKNRPLANGKISPGQAFLFLGGQLSVGLGVLSQLNWYR